MNSQLLTCGLGDLPAKPLLRLGEFQKLFCHELGQLNHLP